MFCKADRLPVYSFSSWFSSWGWQQLKRRVWLQGYVTRRSVWCSLFSRSSICSPSSSSACLQCFEDEERWPCRCRFKTDVCAVQPPIGACYSSASEHSPCPSTLRVFSNGTNGLRSVCWPKRVHLQKSGFLSDRFTLCVWVCMFCVCMYMCAWGFYFSS